MDDLTPLNDEEKSARKKLVDRQDRIEQKLALLPDLPGCYMMRDEQDNILYVGKAKNLKNRVRSYFRGAHDAKTTKLVSEIDHFDTIITNSNKEALLLEINLIQQYKPPFNIKLKDGTMYPYLKITKERNPQLIITNHVVDDGGQYFGPFPNVHAANQTQQLLQKVYPLRHCGKNEKRACFYYHLGQCIGCCHHEVPTEVYDAQIAKIKKFFNGDVKSVVSALQEKMTLASEKLEFEQAADYRDQLHYIETTIERQMIMSKDYDNMDVFGYTYNKGWLSIQVFMLRGGSILKREAAIYPSYSQDVAEDVLSYIVRFYREDTRILPRTVLVQSDIDTTLLSDVLEVPVVTPQRGKKRSMLELCQKNSELALNEKFRMIELNDQKTIGVSEALAQLLNIPLADTIESFDHSHIMGSDYVSGMVVYYKGKPQRKHYRKYKIKTVNGADEYAATQEVIRRRYTRLLKEEKPLPNLILMDGGIVQVRAAQDVLQNELNLSIPVAGMVKNEKHKTAQLLNGKTEDIVEMDVRSQVFHYLQRIQEEVHRYAISYHRQVRSKSRFASILDEVEGVGPATRTKVLKHFKSLQAMREASVEAYRQLGISEKVAKRLIEAVSKI